MPQPVRRLLVLLALLPQLLMLGLGQGVVVCVAPSGHLQVELSASACCDSPPAGLTEAGTSFASDRTLVATDCGSCSDFVMVVDLLGSPDHRKVEFAAPPSAAHIVVEVVAEPEPSLSSQGPGTSRRGVEPLYLGHLRSVVLRC